MTEPIAFDKNGKPLTLDELKKAVESAPTHINAIVTFTDAGGLDVLEISHPVPVDVAPRIVGIKFRPGDPVTVTVK